MAGSAGIWPDFRIALVRVLHDVWGLALTILRKMYLRQHRDTTHDGLGIAAAAAAFLSAFIQWQLVSKIGRQIPKLIPCRITFPFAILRMHVGKTPELPPVPGWKSYQKHLHA
jgi:hypothetical protein